MTEPNADDTMAADYVMGLLEGTDHAAAERRIATDDAFALAVSAWRERLADLDATADETPPSPALWQRIADATKAEPIYSPPSARAALRGATLWNNIRFWRGAGIGGVSAALLFAAIMVGALITSRQLRNDMIALAQRKPIYVAVLVNDTTKEAGAIVNTFANGRVESSAPPIDVPAGRTLQVWNLVDPYDRPEIDRTYRPVTHTATRPRIVTGNRAGPAISRSRWSRKAALRSGGRRGRSCSRGMRAGVVGTSAQG